MLKEMNKNALITINRLVQVATAPSEDKIIKYVIELNKKEKALFVEIMQPSGKFAVYLRKEMENITEDELIPIVDSIEFNDILTKIIDGDEVDISIKDNKILIKASKENIENYIELPYFEEEKEEKQSRENMKTFFKSRKYGDSDNIVNFYEITNKEDPKPDATCEIDLKKLNIKNITNVFDKGAVEVGTQTGVFYLTIGGGRQKQIKNIIRTIRKGETEDMMNIKGECSVFLQDTSCFSILSDFSGYVSIDMKKDFPLAIKKKIPEHKIGVCYIITQLDGMDDL